MEKHIPLDSMVKDLDDIMSRVNGLEVSSTDEYQKAMVSVLKTLVQGEINLFKEFEHLKKAIDLVTLEMFKNKKQKLVFWFWLGFWLNCLCSAGWRVLRILINFVTNWLVSGNYLLYQLVSLWLTRFPHWIN